MRSSRAAQPKRGCLSILRPCRRLRRNTRPCDIRLPFYCSRPVLFWGAAQLQETLVTAVAEAPASTTPLEAVMAALCAAAPMFEERHEFAARRQQIIAANPELQERELIKLASLAGSVAQALRGRGVADPAAILTAEAGTTVFRVAFERWVDPACRRSLQQLIGESMEDLRAATAA